MTVIRAFLDGAIRDETWFLADLDRQAEVGIDTQARGRELFMDWGQVRQLAQFGDVDRVSWAYPYCAGGA